MMVTKGTNIMGMVYKGERLPFGGIASNSSWYETLYNGQTAYITRKYTEFIPE